MPPLVEGQHLITSGGFRAASTLTWQGASSQGGYSIKFGGCQVGSNFGKTKSIFYPKDVVWTPKAPAPGQRLGPVTLPGKPFAPSEYCVPSELKSGSLAWDRRSLGIGAAGLPR